VSDIDDVLDHQNWADKVMASVSKGVTERPPVAGVKYKAFGVHPPEPGNLLGFTIGHRTGEKLVVDVVRDDISVPDAVAVMKHYGITTRITIAEGDEADALAHAVCGLIHELGKQ
jgi:hypothetical protein